MSDHGVFGFLRPDTAFVSFVGNGFCTTIIGVYGLILSLRYFSPVFVMNSFMLQPVLSQVIGVAFGGDTWPGWMTWIGILIIFVAINIMYQGEQQRSSMATSEATDKYQK